MQPQAPQFRRSASLCLVFVIATCASCTFMVEETKQVRSARFDKPGWNTFEVRSAQMTGGVSISGTGSAELNVRAVVAALVSEASKTDAFDGALLGFTQEASRLRLKMSTTGEHAELLYFQQLEIESPATVNLDIEADDSNVIVKDMAGDVHVKSGTGRAEVVTGGSATVVASSGSINIKAGSKASADSGSGEIAVVAGSVIDIRSGSGDVQADTPQGGTVLSSSGKIDVKLTSPNFGITTVETGDNDLVIRVPVGAKYDLDAFSTTGAIDIRVGGLLLNSPYSGPVNGGGPLITARTTSGAIFVLAE